MGLLGLPGTRVRAPLPRNRRSKVHKRAQTALVTSRFDVIVLAGGESRRMGDDKLAMEIAGEPVLDHTLDGIAAVDGAGAIVAVGPRRSTRTAVTWTREGPPRGGPVAAIAAGVAALRSQPPQPASDLFVVVAGDAPLAGGAIPRLVAALDTDENDDEEIDAAILVDDGGRDQLLTAAFRRTALERALAELGDPANLAAQRLVEGLRVARVAAVGDEAIDCDTPDDVALLAVALSQRR